MHLIMQMPPAERTLPLRRHLRRALRDLGVCSTYVQVLRARRRGASLLPFSFICTVAAASPLHHHGSWCPEAPVNGVHLQVHRELLHGVLHSLLSSWAVGR